MNEELKKTESSKRQHSAEASGPRKSLRDEELSLSDFLTNTKVIRKPILQHLDFLPLCHQYHIDPFTPITTPNNLSVYTEIWSTM